MLDDKKKYMALIRLNRVLGQVEGIKRMTQEGRYCIDILHQIAAARSALMGLGRFILDDHMRTCVKSSLKRSGGDKEIKELIDVFEKL